MIETGAMTDAGGGEGVVIWALEQTAGRGRGGRIWSGAPGNLYISVVLSAPEVIGQAPQIGFVAALSLIAAIQEVAPDHASDAALKCKWPNDVLFCGGKVSGILLETSVAPDGSSWVVLGIGVNLNPVEVPDAGYPVTSLAEQGIKVTPARLVDALLHDLGPRLGRWRRDGFEAVRAEWVARAARIGETLTVAGAAGTMRGCFIGLDTDGAMLLEGPGGGRPYRVLAGDVLR